MKIPPIQRQNMISAYERARINPTPARSAGMRADQIDISPEGASFSETFRAVMQAIEEEPSAGRARAAKVQQQVETGKYDVSADEVANAMLRGLRLDKDI